MIDFRTIDIEVNRIVTSGSDRTIEVFDRPSIPFSESGNLFGREEIMFDTYVNRFEVAIKSFHFETKNDHNIAKLKLEPTIYRHSDDPTRKLGIDVIAAFRDESPDDDFENRQFIMTVTLLIIVDRE